MIHAYEFYINRFGCLLHLVDANDLYMLFNMKLKTR